MFCALKLCKTMIGLPPVRTLHRAFPCRTLCETTGENSRSNGVSGNNINSSGSTSHESCRGGSNCSSDLTTLGMGNGVKACLETKSGQRIEIVQGDILDEDVDAIVNPTDKYLLHESKLSSDIMNAAGYLAKRQNEKLILRHYQIPAGSVGVTTGGFLSCHSIIHAVTPVYNDGTEEELDYSIRMLRAVLHYALLMCHDKRYFSVSIPALGAGCNKWPTGLCCRLLLYTTLTFLADHPLTPLKFVCFTDSNPVVVTTFVNEAAELRHPNLITTETFFEKLPKGADDDNETT
eukprot:scpid26657/ scgid32405/ Uncharacterized protein TM_0508